ncbi:methionyl-tRNA formyltransferase, mitochondrial [Uranotaenia lowii]|uniref:methionyl-tRNA formyltransferase, mitochondrial n=1 Tax=Uranotaenia lowii TaxID=190385 RepID=UPI00247A528D|nr:methionyl-tRNA formyltransferase, mitochondrial [Uranotaenia lowii]
MKVLLNMCRHVFEYRRKLIQCRYASSRAEKNQLRILFFGTDSFSLPSLKIINENRKSGLSVSDLEVVTSFKAKKNPLKEYTKQERLALHDWPLRRTDLSRYFDLGVVVSFGHLIPEPLISAFRLGMLNVHASLLPKLRGAAPIVHAIRNGDSETGVTVMKIKPKHFDVGEVLDQRKVSISRDVLMPELHCQMAQVGASALMHCIANLDHYYANLKEQNSCDATYAPKIDAHFADIRWTEMDALQVYNLWRSLYSYKPLTTRLGQELVKIFELSFDPGSKEVDAQKQPPGLIRYCWKRKLLTVCCRDGRCVSVQQLAIGGKKAVTAQEFYNGYLSKKDPSERLFDTG